MKMENFEIEGFSPHWKNLRRVDNHNRLWSHLLIRLASSHSWEQVAAVTSGDHLVDHQDAGKAFLAFRVHTLVAT